MTKDISVKRKIFISLLALNLLILMAPSPTFAHKVNVFAYSQGDTVYTESYFPDGKKVEGGLIEVYDSQGNKLLTGETDKEGQFNFKPPKRCDLKIVINASLGHKNAYILSADELSQAIDVEKPQEIELEQSEEESEAKKIAQVDVEQIKRIVDGSLDEKLKPIMLRLRKAEQKKTSFTEVIGGIGYIFGIMGLILYFLSKKKRD